MKAAVLHEPRKPLVVEEVERPRPGDAEVLIQVEACGVCHSDLHVADGDWKQFASITKTPLILGHEIAGRVVETGSAVRDLKIGDRVGVPWVYWTCGECEFCREGYENLCVKQKITGVTVDGGYAEFLKAPASHATKIPDSVSSIQAAPLFCAGVTVYRALMQAKPQRGQRLAVFGIGGLGHLAIQIAVNLGLEVSAIDVEDEKLALAKSLGAVHTANATTTNVVKEMRKRGNAHIALVTSGSKAAYDTAFYCVRPTGTLLAVGLPANEISFPAIMMAAGEVNIKASAVGTRADLQKVLALAAEGKLHCQVATRPLSDANAVLEEMRSGKVSGRIVLTM
jgi:alcohol dehydrogenase, propanol-preferring